MLLLNIRRKESMKRLVLSLSLVLLLGLVGCGKSPVDTVGTGDVDTIGQDTSSEQSVGEDVSDILDRTEGNHDIEDRDEPTWEGPQMVAGPLNLVETDGFIHYEMYDSFYKEDGNYSVDILVPSLDLYNANSKASRSEQVYLLGNYDWNYGDTRPEYYYTIEDGEDKDIFTYELRPVETSVPTQYDPRVMVRISLDTDFIYLDAEFLLEQQEDTVDDVVSNPNRDKSNSDEITTLVTEDYMGGLARHASTASNDLSLNDMIGIRRFIDDRQILTIEVLTKLELDVTDDMADEDIESLREQGRTESWKYIQDILSVYGLDSFAQELLENGEVPQFD